MKIYCRSCNKSMGDISGAVRVGYIVMCRECHDSILSKIEEIVKIAQDQAKQANDAMPEFMRDLFKC